MSMISTIVIAMFAGGAAPRFTAIADNDWRRISSPSASVEVPCTDSQVVDSQERHKESEYAQALICEQPEISHWFRVGQIHMQTPQNSSTAFDAFLVRATNEDGSEHVRLAEFAGHRAFNFESTRSGNSVIGRVVEMGSNDILIQISGFYGLKSAVAPELGRQAQAWSTRFLSSLQLEGK